MKFKNFYSALALLLATSIASQVQAQIGIGFRAGVLTSSQTFKEVVNGQEEEFDTDNITGYVVGIPLEIGLSKVLAFQTEVNYLRQGFARAENRSQLIPESKTTYDVFEVPVLAKIGWTSKRISIAAVVGPSFQYIASGRTEVTGFSTDLITIESRDDKIDFSQGVFEEITRTNIYGQAGAQLGIPAGGGKFVLDARYRFAITDQDARDDFEVRGQGASATLGYILTFGNY